MSVVELASEKVLSLPDHLIPLPGGRWAAWRWAGLRGAGFPAEHIFRLAASDCARAADAVIEASDESDGVRKETLHRLHQSIEGSVPDQRRLLNRAIGRIRKDKPPETFDLPAGSQQAVEAFRSAHARTETARLAFEQVFQAGVDRISRVLYETVHAPRFREAVIWQNRQALARLDHSIGQAPVAPPSRNSQYRRDEELVASYLQRYCVKNDTIGFFGPVGWAKLASDGAALRARPGDDLLATRQVYFESWCIETLAETLARDKALRPWLAPRRMPFIHLEGSNLYLPAKRPMKLSPEQVALLQACDGERTAQAIALQLLQNPSFDLKETEVYLLLETLQTMGLIQWTLEAPLEAHPERTLRRQLERIDDAHLRQSKLNAVDILDDARQAVAQSAGDAEQLNRALSELEAAFTRLTATAATRGAGKVYAARTLVYEDCRRDLDLELGPQILEALGPPLALLLASARWFTFEAAARYRKILRDLYQKLAWKAGTATLPLVDCWLQLQPMLFNNRASPLEAITPVFQQRWERILAIPPGERRVCYQTDTLRPRVSAEFAAPRPGWQFARYHSPDVLIAASSIDAICRDDYELVMGELHIGTNTLRAGSFMDQHPAPDEIFRALEQDLPRPRLAPIPPKGSPELTTRTRPVFVLPRDFQLAFTYDACAPLGSKTLPIGAFVVEERTGNLVVRTRDGRLSFDLIEVLAETIAQQVVSNFHILRPERHTPRINFDRLIVCRESWSLPAEEFTFVSANTDAERFVAYRRWARALGLPRFVFVRTPLERKPFYVDSDSPILINLFARAARRVIDAGPADAPISVTEMIPTPQQTWLPDAAGRSYTSELRLIAVDLVD